MLSRGGDEATQRFEDAMYDIKEAVTEACEIAAYYSKAQGGSVEVDYTLAKHVKKPNG